jgi:parallel beta-helix repeat protein
MIIALSVLLISVIASGAWLFQVLSVAQTITLTKDTYDTLFPTLIVTEDTVLTEDYSGHIVIEEDGVTLDGNGYTITGAGWWRWSSIQRMWNPSVGVYMEGRTGVTVKNCRVTNFATGFSVHNSDGNIFLNNSFCENVDFGFIMTFSYNNTLLNNTAYSNRDTDNNYDGGGFLVEMSFGNIFKGNVAYDNGRGFQISEFEKDIFEEERGFIPEKFEGNIFEANTAQDNTEAGFYIGGIDNSFSNIFFHNNLIDNTIQAAVPLGYTNTWDDDYPSGGNYWSDYEGADDDGDGIGDSQYDIRPISHVFEEDNEEPILVVGEPDGNNVDRFPLMAPFNG